MLSKISIVGLMISALMVLVAAKDAGNVASRLTGGCGSTTMVYYPGSGNLEANCAGTCSGGATCMLEVLDLNDGVTTYAICVCDPTPDKPHSGDEFLSSDKPCQQSFEWHTVGSVVTTDHICTTLNCPILGCQKWGSSGDTYMCSCP